MGPGHHGGGGEGIVKLEENNLLHDLGTNPVVMTPFLWIPPSF